MAARNARLKDGRSRGPVLNVDSEKNDRGKRLVLGGAVPSKAGVTRHLPASQNNYFPASARRGLHLDSERVRRGQSPPIVRRFAGLQSKHRKNPRGNAGGACQRKWKGESTCG
ncbi:uncharacterized protein LOC133508782 isoform X2 [Syngnathoides biaculeatus]|uniref:uncharacterized protein LOC133508782 isoform X2 n=1 Tax=Syngnathoides biaculeatus TaxID=300417 RepID=UPI002ADDBB00|nr:uncharacterized protein LOC133508782 isoform X2 [Syngnathoides biaculeatus]XP_061691180.1 uncharacterized protein LOC133508782 isoform X2 [Syngnathoides biaculeatus]XP_061691181.1 uncharacterized protein LOC133508782 isoform X2 [Syngnathoides biaculeatus]